MATRETKLQIVIDAVNRAGGAFASIGRELDEVSSSTANLRSGMMAVGAAGAVAAAGLGLVTKQVIEAGSNYEQTQVAFASMIGNAEEAQATLNQLNQFAAKTPFQIPQIQEAGKQLLAYGFSTKELIPSLTKLGNVAAALNIPLGDMTYLYGTLRTQGRAYTRDLIQFTQRGIPIIDELAKTMGIAKSQVMEFASEGKIGFAEVQAAFEDMNAKGGIFYDHMAVQSQTLAGQWSNFKDQITLTSVVIGTQLLPYLKPLLQDLMAVMNVVKEFAIAHPQLTAVILVGALAFASLIAVLLPIAIVLPTLISLVGFLTAAFVAFTAVSAPVLLAIAAIGTALVVLIANGYFTKQAWQDVWLGIKVITAEAVNSVIATVEGMINFIINGVNSAIAAINRVIAAAQKIPGIGKYIPSLSQLPTVDLGRIDTGLIAANDLAGRGGSSNTTVQVSGNVLLSQDVAAQIGDLIMGKLKLSKSF